MSGLNVTYHSPWVFLIKCCVCYTPYKFLSLKKDGPCFPGVTSVVKQSIMATHTPSVCNSIHTQTDGERGYAVVIWLKQKWKRQNKYIIIIIYILFNIIIYYNIIYVYIYFTSIISQQVELLFFNINIKTTEIITARFCYILLKRKHTKCTDSITCIVCCMYIVYYCMVAHNLSVLRFYISGHHKNHLVHSGIVGLKIG